MKAVWLILCMILSMSIVSAQPFFLTGTQNDPTAGCNTYEVLERRFEAFSTRATVGYACPNDVRIAFYQCNDDECRDKFLVTQGYLVNSEKPELGNLTIGQMYAYECLACESDSIPIEEIPYEETICPVCETCQEVVCPACETCKEESKQKYYIAMVLLFLLGFVSGMIFDRWEHKRRKSKKSSSRSK